MNCSNCMSSNTKKEGFRILSGGYKKQRYRCMDCGKRFSDDRENPKNTGTYQETDKYINIVYANTPLKTKDDVIREYKIDMKRWKIDFFEVKPSQVQRKDRSVYLEFDDGKMTGSVADSGKMLVVQLYNLRIKFVPLTLESVTLDEIEEMFVKREFTSPVVRRKDYLPSDETLEIDITDLHFGSDANHNPEKRLLDAIDDVIFRIGKRSFKKIIVALLGDIYHYDTMSKTTSAGTVVSTNGDTVYQTVDLGLNTLVTALQKLSESSPLEVIFVPGNHDRLASYMLIKALEAYFRNNENIAIDAGHSSRKHRVIGVSLVGWMHGDIPKKRESNWLQVNAREDWGRTKYSEIHSGNFHSQSGKEDGGVILRYLPGLTDIDDWHYDNAYVGAIRAMVSFVWHETKGMREMWFTNV